MGCLWASYVSLLPVPWWKGEGSLHKNVINCLEYDTMSSFWSSIQTFNLKSNNIVLVTVHYQYIRLILSSSIIAKCLQKPFQQIGILQKRTGLLIYATYHGNQCTKHKAGLCYNSKIRIWINRLCKIQMTDHGMICGCRASTEQHIQTWINIYTLQGFEHMHLALCNQRVSGEVTKGNSNSVRL